jgi:hypothetical protein
VKHNNPAQVKARRLRRLKRDGKRHASNLKAFITFHDNRLNAAVQTLTLTGNAVNAETVVVDGKTYTWDAALTNTDGHVKIGATAAASLVNLFNAINHNGAGVSGTDYAAAMTQHPSVFADLVTATTLRVRARVAGTGGNAKATTETMTAGSWGAATLAGGGSSWSTAAKLKHYGFRRIRAASAPGDLP